MGELTTGLDVEAVLRDHEGSDLRAMDSELTPGCVAWWSICECGERAETQATGWHRAHVAAVLRVEIESALGDVLREAAEDYEQMYQQPGSATGADWLRRRAAQLFPYRASLAATEGDRQ